MNWLRRRYTPFRISACAGLGLGVCTLLIHLYLKSFQHGDGLATSIELHFWIFGGIILLGAIPVFVLARYRIFSPVLASGGVYAGALITSWTSMIESAQSSGAGITPTWFDFVLWFWFLILAAALIIGALEYKILRTVVSSRSGSTM